jgi:thiamine biosynthesis lipoprotein
MALVETLPLDACTAQWPLWSTTARLVVTDPAALPPAEALVRGLCDDVELACSRFRPDAEIHALARAAGRMIGVSPLLADLLAAALDAAESTQGAVDPTLGHVLTHLGYDRDIADLTDLAGPADLPTEHGAVRITARRRASWREVELHQDRAGIPDGVELDLGATAKAFTADRCAELVAARFGVGVLVALGGDVATAGPNPDGGWRLLVQDGPDEPAATVAVESGTGVATSSTLSRRWQRDGRLLHHVLDPVTGLPADPVFRTVTVAAPSCLRANTLSTAAVVRGEAAVGMLRSARVPARLVLADGSLLHVGGWPPALDAGRAA